MDLRLESSFRGLSAVDSLTAWLSGTQGVFAFTQDGGVAWVTGTVPGADSLDFRDVESFSGGVAYLMSAGGGPLSRLYKTTDWGETWALQHTNPLENGFFNGMTFWDRNNGMVVGDPVDGSLFLLATNDGGENWQRLEGEHIPRVFEGEYGFAASGTNIAAFGESGLAVVSGGPVARVFISPDRGESWRVTEVPMASGNASSGIFSIGFGVDGAVVLVGGDYQDPERTLGTVAFSANGGVDWALVPEPSPVGFRSCVAWNDDSRWPMWVAVGTSGSSFSMDGGGSWVNFDDGPFNVVAFSGPMGWAAGPDG
ncbi:MAG: glycosyl hydrolase, partial [Gemmatimonadetes bacterium]|nr:glycosyl hydrolase [Gemmatimonadota bacterium]